jgi:hypothetical protein
VVEDLINGGQVHYSEEVRFILNPQTGEFFPRSSHIHVH